MATRFESLLQLAGPLLDLHSGGKNKNAPVDLQPLCPIFECLLRALPASDDLGDVKLAIKRTTVTCRAIPSEQERMQDILRGRSSQPKRLLCFQYLLWCSEGLEQESNFVKLLPLLLNEESVEMLSALLSTIMQRKSESSDTIRSQIAHSSMLVDCISVPTKWSKACVVVERLQLADLAVTLLQESLRHALTAKTDDLPDFLGPTVHSLLPLLKDSVDHCRNVWQFCWEHVYDSSSTVSLIVMTTVLCVLLPSVRKLEMPQLNSSELELPWRQAVVWELVFACVRQGCQSYASASSKQSWIRGSSGNTKKKSRKPTPEATTESNSLLLRRRGLYMIRIMMEGQKEHKLWHSYVAVFETAEMEQEAHLLEQIWGTVRTLFVQASTYKTDVASATTVPPPITIDWTMALLGRALISPELPVLRKFAMYRFLRGEAGIALRSEQEGCPLNLLPPEFVFEVVLQSYNSLSDSVGLNMQMEDVQKKVITEDMRGLMRTFLAQYLASLEKPAAGERFFSRLMSQDIVCDLHRKTTEEILQSVSGALRNGGRFYSVNESVLQSCASSFQSVFSLGSVVQSLRTRLLSYLAVILKHTRADKNPSPPTILGILSLFPLDTDHPELCDWVKHGIAPGTKGWARQAAGAIATAFVDGTLENTAGWDAESGTTEVQLATAKAITLLCLLAVAGEEKASASSLLWPAIHKGLSFAPMAVSTPSWSMADRVARALALLENGCRVQILSGMGNGDLVVDSKTEQMMPPPPNIEDMLVCVPTFLFHHLKALVPGHSRNTRGGGQRSDNARKLSATYLKLIHQFQTIQRGFPSSMSISCRVNEALKKHAELVAGQLDDAKALLESMFVVHVALAAEGSMDIVHQQAISRKLLTMEFDPPHKTFGRNIQACRSLFHLSRWGILSSLINTLNNGASVDPSRIVSLHDTVFDVAAESVEATPLDALPSLFNCVVTAGRCTFLTPKSASSSKVSLESVIRTLVKLAFECKAARDQNIMLEGICHLIFDPSLLLEEQRQLNPAENKSSPVRSAFRDLLAMTGKNRTFLHRTVLSYAASGWLGKDRASAGVAAIPYVDDFKSLLLLKDESVEEQAGGSGSNSDTPMKVYAHEQSISRGILLSFLDELPNKGDIASQVQSGLLDPLTRSLLEELRPSGSTNQLMFGTPEYCKKSRGWQALCVLSRFFTSAIIEDVRDKIFEALHETLHGQIRYFIEVLAIQCSRQFPEVFAGAIIHEISQHRDISLQTISSLMVISGNLVVGRYKEQFMEFITSDNDVPSRLDKLISGVVPFLSSTQGFSRAIAQLLVYKLIPLRIDVEQAGSVSSNDWFLLSIFKHLDENTEMKRLRTKQADFFSKYEVETICTAQGVLRTPVDESGEAFPRHMIDVIKATLKDVYEESRGDDAPTWKLQEQVADAQVIDDDVDANDNEPNITFQRKIIPLDALNLALEELAERRERNAAGRKKQDLIVCASLVDKIPNLGGLARTSEIFGAHSLIIPDKKVKKMDNFTSISVGAGEWIAIEECREANLLKWLLEKRQQGYFILGIEQTSTSMPLHEFRFPLQPIVLLLGKEKEGIPVQFLQAVDACVEVPQFGIIRSLNVHVTGAISIWEFTKQRLEQNAE